MKGFSIHVFYSVEDRCYPDLKYCSAHGLTPEKALKEVLVAKELWIESARELGRPIPAPKVRTGRRV